MESSSNFTEEPSKELSSSVQKDVSHSFLSESVVGSNLENAEFFSRAKGSVESQTLEEEKNENLVLSKLSDSEDPAEESIKNSCDLQVDQPSAECELNAEVSVLRGSVTSNTECSGNSQCRSKGKLSEAVIISSKPLCADYMSDTGSVDSESDSSATSTSATSDTSRDNDSDSESDDSHDSATVNNKMEKGGKKAKNEFSFTDLPPIENLKISVPEGACVEIGIITSIVETLIVVESYKGTAALDVDTVLFLDQGKKTLGKIFEILGPVAEPVYAVRFNNKEQIKDLNIEKGTKAYYAPETEHTTFVFMSEVLKNRGSDASWKDNAEAPPEFQDFSDDEEEMLHKNEQVKESRGESLFSRDPNKSRKRSFNKAKQSSGVFQGAGFRNPNFFQQRPNFQRNPSINQFASPPQFPRSNFPVRIPSFPYNVPSYPCVSAFPVSPHMAYTPRFSGPPFPTFGVQMTNRTQNFQHPCYQSSAHGFPQGFGAWRRPPFRPSSPAEWEDDAGPASEINP